MVDDPNQSLSAQLTPWEQRARDVLAAVDLPMWQYKARSVTYAQGHRGIIDFDLRFPSEYLKGPALDCYVWKKEVEDGTRVHAYADVDGRQFHLRWQDAREVQRQPIHEAGACAISGCKPCLAASDVAAMCRGDSI